MPISRKAYAEEENQFLKNIGLKVRFIRNKHGISRFELAEKSDLSYATISHPEAHRPTASPLSQFTESPARSASHPASQFFRFD
jgi:transcriptional regulator with XRE-family HTH domain